MVRRTWVRLLVVTTSCLAVAAFVQLGVDTGSHGQSVPEFPQPDVYESSDAMLSFNLRAVIARNVIRDVTGVNRVVQTPTFNGRIPGPTFRVKPGDALDLLLLNDLPRNPARQRGGNFPHDPYTTNLHTHGWTVSPAGISDNVLRLMEPRSRSPIRVQLPGDHQSGTFWYHPHKHGSVSFQLFGGMAGFLIVEGGPGTLDDLPEVKAARDVLMAFQEIRTDQNGRLPFVNPSAMQLGTDPVTGNPGLWSTLKNGRLFMTTNGVTNPALHMSPGEVQRWRFLNAASGATLVVALQGHAMNIVANDGITAPNVQALPPGVPYVLGTGQRGDVLVKAGRPGVYKLQALDPGASPGWPVISGTGIDPAPRNVRFSFDLPNPTWPVTLATIIVSGPTRSMRLPTGPLPVPRAIPSIRTMLSTPPNVVRKIVFEICGERVFMQALGSRLPTCGWYQERYNPPFWGGTPFTSLNMMRDDNDPGTPSGNPAKPLINFAKESLFHHDEPLFDDMFVGNREEWTIINRSFSDHTFHIHQNPFLVTHVNGKRLRVPQWRDTVLVPAAQPQPGANPVNINQASFGSITFRTFFDPDTVGGFVMHCHVLNHEDIGMMQRLEIRPGPGPRDAGRRPDHTGPGHSVRKTADSQASGS
ncbi:MAG TPA: multicopper oxidase family protein [Methylomirabilota bacterium]|nr:multicopper oxidase family protein [Methylomirabilota bacterium]